MARSINKFIFELRAMRRIRATKKRAIKAFLISAKVLLLASVDEPHPSAPGDFPE